MTYRSPRSRQECWPTPAIVEVVAELATQTLLPHLVVDPVLIASSGAPLTTPDTLDAYRARLLPLAKVFTPNLLEAGALLGLELRTLADQRDAARRLGQSTEAVIVVKGGHAVTDASGYAVDVIWDGKELRQIRRPRIPTTNTHGSGCSFAAAIAAGLARSMTASAAIDAAGDFVHRAIQDSAGWRLGAGHGPLDHFGWARRNHQTRSHPPVDPVDGRTARHKTPDVR